jgi:nucleoside-diphosphate-sugar epimerase
MRSEEQMRILVAGANGVLGRRICKQLVDHGHTVFGMVRTTEAEQMVQPLGVEVRRADLLDADAVLHAASGAEVVIHAATSIPKKIRPSGRDWEMNDRIRTEGTRALMSAAISVGARVFMMQSIVWVAQPKDGSPFDEDSPTHSNSIMRSMVEGERIVREGGKDSGLTVSILRCGTFYSADSYHTRIFGDSMRKRRMAIVDGGKAKWSLVHAEDAAGAFVAATEAGRSGLWHVIDDYPVSTGEFFSYLAEKLGTRPPRHLPRWLFSLLLGRYSADFFSTSMETSNSRFKKDFAWTPRFPSYKEGLVEVVKAWQSEGYLTG